MSQKRKREAPPDPQKQPDPCPECGVPGWYVSDFRRLKYHDSFCPALGGSWRGEPSR